MKLKTLSCYAVLSCGVLLLCHAPAAAQKPPAANIDGTYVLDDPAAAPDTIKKAINVAVKGMGWPAEGFARRRLEKSNLPPYRRIVILLGVRVTDVSITTDARAPIVTPPDGTPVEWTREDKEKFKVSTTVPVDAGPLKQTFQSEDGQRVNTYVVGSGGKTLNMEVVVSSPRLPRPVTYTLTYKRAP